MMHLSKKYYFLKKSTNLAVISFTLGAIFFLLSTSDNPENMQLANMTAQLKVLQSWVFTCLCR